MMGSIHYRQYAWKKNGHFKLKIDRGRLPVISYLKWKNATKYIVSIAIELDIGL